MKDPAWLTESNRKHADKNDRRKAKVSNGEYRTQPNSGAGNKRKLDLCGDIDNVETKFTKAASFRIRATEVEKARRDNSRAGSKFSWFAFEITLREGTAPIRITIIETEVYERLKEAWRRD